MEEETTLLKVVYRAENMRVVEEQEAKIIPLNVGVGGIGYGIGRGFAKKQSGIGSADDVNARKAEILAKETAEQDNNYNFFYKDKDKMLRLSAEKIATGGPDENTIVINAHGVNKGKMIGAPTELGTMTPEDLHLYLMKNNATYQRSLTWGDKITVRLEACSTGKSFAQKFSSYNPNMTVVAPSDDIMNVMLFYNYVQNNGSYLRFSGGVPIK